ncbi:hypothetical protein BDW69DRAFT_16873, partial [Aspergillus filifer]
MITALDYPASHLSQDTSSFRFHIISLLCSTFLAYSFTFAPFSFSRLRSRAIISSYQESSSLNRASKKPRAVSALPTYRRPVTSVLFNSFSAYSFRCFGFDLLLDIQHFRLRLCLCLLSSSSLPNARLLLLCFSSHALALSWRCSLLFLLPSYQLPEISPMLDFYLTPWRIYLSEFVFQRDIIRFCLIVCDRGSPWLIIIVVYSLRGVMGAVLPVQAIGYLPVHYENKNEIRVGDLRTSST